MLKEELEDEFDNISDLGGKFPWLSHRIAVKGGEEDDREGDGSPAAVPKEDDIDDEDQVGADTAALRALRQVCLDPLFFSATLICLL